MGSVGRLRNVVLASAILILLLAISACGGDEQEQQSKKLTYWVPQEADSLEQDEAIFNKVVGDFEKQKGITVEVKAISWDDLYQDILTAITSGQGPDVLNIGNTWAASLQATGAFVPFDEEAMAKIGGEDKFVPAAMSSTGAPGQPPGSVPLYLLPDPVLYYNKAMFEEAGLQRPPKTWDGFIEVGKEFTKDTDGDGESDQWGVVTQAGDLYGNLHKAFVLSQQYGGQWFDKNGKPTFVSPENVDAVKLYVDLIAKDKILPPRMASAGEGTESVSDFVNGKAAMMISPSTTTASLESRGMKTDEYGLAPLPVLDPLPAGGEPAVGYVSGTNTVVFKNASNQELALDFVKYLTSSEKQVELSQAYGSLFPAVNEALEKPAFQGGQMDVFTEILKNSAPLPQVPQEGEFETFVGKAVSKLIQQAATTGSVTESDVRTELEAAQERIKAGGGG
jgi:multiple sugar transport system substrate-binding protein